MKKIINPCISPSVLSINKILDFNNSSKSIRKRLNINKTSDQLGIYPTRKLLITNKVKD